MIPFVTIMIFARSAICIPPAHQESSVRACVRAHLFWSIFGTPLPHILFLNVIFRGSKNGPFCDIWSISNLRSGQSEIWRSITLIESASSRLPLCGLLSSITNIIILIDYVTAIFSENRGIQSARSISKVPKYSILSTECHCSWRYVCQFLGWILIFRQTDDKSL